MAVELIAGLTAICEERGYLLYAAAAMPDHVHVVPSLKPTTTYRDRTNVTGMAA